MSAESELLEAEENLQQLRMKYERCLAELRLWRAWFNGDVKHTRGPDEDCELPCLACELYQAREKARRAVERAGDLQTDQEAIMLLTRKWKGWKFKGEDATHIEIVDLTDAGVRFNVHRRGWTTTPRTLSAELWVALHGPALQRASILGLERA